jgi:hypothetical protein
MIIFPLSIGKCLFSCWLGATALQSDLRIPTIFIILLILILVNLHLYNF